MKIASSFSKVAPGFLGAFFLSVTFSSCKAKDSVPDWQGQAKPATSVPSAASEATPKTATLAASPDAAGAKPDATDAAGDATAATPAGGVTSPDSSEGTRFVTYNVENWLTMDRTENGVSEKGKSKPEKERNAVIAMILAANPDVLGVCEMGGDAEVVEIQKMLADAGHPMPYHVMVGGVDPTRHLGLISRFTIGTPTVHQNLTYTSNGKSYGMQRGILDAVVQTPSGPIRFLGVHLKSKRDVAGDDQEDMRLNEAHLLRREVDGILEKDPQAKLVVYGDMNDTRNSSAIKTVQGSGKGPTTLTLTGLKDSRGEYWTEHWAYQDVYSRIDYVMLSNSLKSSLIWDECRILDEPIWSKGSDHRPLLVVIKKEK